ncbi:GTP pyrophosphokinase [Microbacterium bovistercoris]|uniref:GTP pyrophosphokinase n=1 Tax=Microbacterium bovistercoris TaxID=2293570 RepID=A0A371NYZ9_9MICO|nr:RelA/SpoT domain-containing protein [Microbacterium bovistercoris]REJ07830.1 GTP pyrophosphokinase [Microbacterium bovistercoris]
MTRWAVQEYSRTQVKRAGELIGGRGGSDEEVKAARAKISNFRSAHGYPLLSVTMHVRDKAAAVSSDVVVARRLKRLPTILDKLERQPTMNVTTMQDLGGCRVVLSSVTDVYELLSALEAANPQSRIVRKKDYIAEPQTTGYRGVHLIYSYGASKTEYHGLKVEVQIRTELQHAWATSVETMDLFSGSRLKYNEGDPMLRRYFVVVAALMTHHESTAAVPSAEAAREELREELAELEGRLGITELLSGYAAIVGGMPTSDRRSTIVLKLWRDTRQLGVSVFETQADAEEHLATVEALNDENIDAVLISISKVGQLQSAYPNYFANTTAFVDFVSSQLDMSHVAHT